MADDRALEDGVHDSRTTDLDLVTLYRILELRSAVFVVEQECAYLDPDGRDLEAGARQLWITHGDTGGTVVATLRMLTEPDGTCRVGRVATAQSARGAGLAAALMRRALRLAGPAVVVLDAQAHLEQWYARFGFVRTGADYLEDGIPHVPMRRDVGGRRAATVNDT